MAKADDKADVWMPLYIGDYLADTNRLTTEQHGAYLLLIMDYWRNGPPPDDEEILQNVTRLSKFLWKKHGPVLQKFFTVENGVWRHKRIDEEMAGASSGKAAASEKARIAANARWSKNDAPSNAQAHAPEMLEECPSPSPSPISKTEGTKPAPVEPASGRAKPADLTTAMRKHSVAAQPGDPRIIAAAEAGVTVESVEAACAEAKGAKPGERISAGYVIAIAERWTREAATPKPSARASPQPRSYHDDRADTLAKLTGRKAAHEPAPAEAIDVDATEFPRKLG